MNQDLIWKIIIPIVTVVLIVLGMFGGNHPKPIVYQNQEFPCMVDSDSLTDADDCTPTQAK